MMRFACLILLIATLGAARGQAESVCADVCLVGEVQGEATCRLWDASSSSWRDDWDDGPGQLHNRARNFVGWLHAHMLPAGGVMAAQMTDPTLSSVEAYRGRRDPAIWTGAYLAAEAMRLMVTGAPDAARHVDSSLRTLHRWWRIADDPGYLARYAAPADSPPPILAALSADDAEVHRDTPFAGGSWHWRSNTSRDQYQGVMLGYSLAYEATADPELRDIIREDVLAFAEQLMRRERVPVVVHLPERRLTLELEAQHVVYTDDETPDGLPAIEIQTDPPDVKGLGALVFWPNPSEYLRQIPGLEQLPDIYLSTQAIQLAATFAVALQVSANVPGYEQRWRALRDHYEANVSEWLRIAARWRNSNRCDDGYHGLNIAFIPGFNWARVEPDRMRQAVIRRLVLGDRLWREVREHKNVFFAFIYASQNPHARDAPTAITEHLAQLARFPAAPNLAVAVDLRDKYPEDPHCPGISAVAVDVDERVPATFVWERHPWKLYDPGVPNRIYPGIDYLLAYWLGRHAGFIEDDAPDTCLRWYEG